MDRSILRSQSTRYVLRTRARDSHAALVHVLGRQAEPAAEPERRGDDSAARLDFSGVVHTARGGKITSLWLPAGIFRGCALLEVRLNCLVPTTTNAAARPCGYLLDLRRAIPSHALPCARRCHAVQNDGGSYEVESCSYSSFGVCPHQHPYLGFLREKAPEQAQQAGGTAPAQTRSASKRIPTATPTSVRTHIHTSWSFDAWLFGNRLTGPADALSTRRARPSSIRLGYDIKIKTPMDFMGVTDHSEYVGTVARSNTPGSLRQQAARRQPPFSKYTIPADVQRIFTVPRRTCMTGAAG